jgi:GNAT superfamily N-acetyltransferase
VEKIEYRMLKLSKLEISEIVVLLKKCFPNSKKFSEEYLTWLYVDNPNGKAVGYNAYIGEELVGHYSCIPMKAYVKGVAQSGLLSLNTATDPKCQGKGLFRKLANDTYYLAKQNGFKFVCGVANSRSSLLFVKLLKFQHVSSLDVKLSFRSVVTPGHFSNIHNMTDFSTEWNKESIKWRMANPVNHGRCKVDSNLSIRVFSNTEYPMIVNDGYGLISGTVDNIKSYFSIRDTLSLKMALCLYPKEIINNKLSSFHVNLPDRFKPSPLNFIFKDLTAESTTISADRVFFNYLDFDAY